MVAADMCSGFAAVALQCSLQHFHMLCGLYGGSAADMTLGCTQSMARRQLAAQPGHLERPPPLHTPALTS